MNLDQQFSPGARQPGNKFFRPGWLIVAAAVLIFVGLALFATIHGHGNPGPATGEVIVNTNDPGNAISITSFDNQTTQNDTGSLDATLPPGSYTVTVTGKQLSASQLVTVSAGHVTRITLNPGKLGDAEPVTDLAAGNVAADSAGLRFTAGGSLIAVGAGNSEQVQDTANGFTRVSWAGPAYGVGKSKTGQLFVINGSQITPFSTPVSTASFSLAPNRLLYISDGSQVFAGNPGGSFKKLFQASGSITILAASNAAVAASEGPAGAPNNNLVRTITSDGSVHDRTFSSYQAAWSPSGKYLVVSGDETTIVTDAALNQVASIPATNVTSPVWLDDNTAFYGVGSGLWRFDRPSGRSNLLASMPGGAYVTSISPSAGGDFVYLVLQSSSHSGDDVVHLDRLGLHGQAASAAAVSLSALLPNPIGPCTVGYLNFSKTTVDVRGPAGSAAACTQAAQSFLAPYSSVIGSGIGYQYTQL
jgi:hypothetical protein